MLRLNNLTVVRLQDADLFVLNAPDIEQCVLDDLEASLANLASSTKRKSAFLYFPGIDVKGFDLTGNDNASKFDAAIVRGQLQRLLALIPDPLLLPVSS